MVKSTVRAVLRRVATFRTANRNGCATSSTNSTKRRRFACPYLRRTESFACSVCIPVDRTPTNLSPAPATDPFGFSMRPWGSLISFAVCASSFSATVLRTPLDPP